MQSYKGIVINLGRSGALPRILPNTVSNVLLGNGSYRAAAGNILQNNISTTTPATKEGGGLFQSIFGKNVELQHAPHKEVNL